MIDTLVKRIGESQFLREIDINQVNFDEIVQDADNFEQLIKRFGLTCLLDSGEDNDKLEPAFAEHINLRGMLSENVSVFLLKIFSPSKGR